MGQYFTRFDENNAKLLVALTGYEFCNAAEILRYNYPGWKKIDTENMTRLMMSAFYPTIRYYFPVANGNGMELLAYLAGHCCFY